MALSRTEADVMLLHDGGFKRREISRDLGLKPSYVDAIVARYSLNMAEDRRRENRIRERTARLGAAVIAAGGHR